METQKRIARDTVRIAREKKRLTQEALAAQVGISQQALARIESGDTRMPKRDTAMRIAAILEIPLESILFGDDAEPGLPENAVMIAREYARADPVTQHEIMAALLRGRQRAERTTPREREPT